MIQDIDLIGIDDNLIEKIKNNLEYDDVLSLACNYKKVKKNIEYFKMIGINNIDELLLNRHYIFLINNDKLVRTFNNYNLVDIASNINKDYTYIDEII